MQGNGWFRTIIYGVSVMDEDMHRRTGQLDELIGEARSLVEAIREGAADDRARRRAHRLRETLGVALILSERLARDAGNGEMVQLEATERGGRASFSVDLDSDEWNLN